MRQHEKIKDLALCALFTAVLCLCAWIAIPTPTGVITLQSFGVLLALLTLGGRRGLISIGVYLLLGAVGLPVFSGFRGGTGALLGSTGGYLWGFALGAGLYWLLTALLGSRGRIPGAVLALLICYVCGSLWYGWMFAPSEAMGAILLQCVVPYLLPDAIKLSVALALAHRLRNIPQLAL